MINKICEQCGKLLFKKKKESYKQFNSKRYCSIICRGLAYKGSKHSNETKKKMSDNHANVKGSKNPCWKGELAGKVALHRWVIKRKGKAKMYKCIDCGKQAHDWSNKDHTYKRILNHYKPRCMSCHRLYDLKNNLKPDNKIGSNQFKEHTLT